MRSHIEPPRNTSGMVNRWRNGSSSRGGSPFRFREVPHLKRPGRVGRPPIGGRLRPDERPDEHAVHQGPGKRYFVATAQVKRSTRRPRARPGWRHRRHRHRRAKIASAERVNWCSATSTVGYCAWYATAWPIAATCVGSSTCSEMPSNPPPAVPGREFRSGRDRVRPAQRPRPALTALREMLRVLKVGLVSAGAGITA